ncbi:hypothetical protein [Arthrobacter zhaoguopingii]|uniref:hypothetical protein n=1 Tax=Arthrobacter zhaoguopingii TaxID=2681491 RepID=UPI001356C98A|nr:hypothetical protein [Arthrobacter zhaoguopingii]
MMKPFLVWLRQCGLALHPLALVLLVIFLNVFWTLTLRAFGGSFQRVAGAPLLDLENVRGVLAPREALELLQGYGTEAQALYWTFFALDSVVPLLSFGSYALLWAFLLARSPWPRSQRLARSPLLLVPFGVGVFDIGENLFFVSALASSSSSEALGLVTAGLVLVYAKAACLLMTFLGTLILTAAYGAGRIVQIRRTAHA